MFKIKKKLFDFISKVYFRLVTDVKLNLYSNKDTGIIEVQSCVEL